ncbi:MULTISPECIES: hypothetical protein [Catenuloplanes]|uniref:Uncharacterized protein n=1 Tax=Catenuloplanes niger TaxID=587534 RepID=A0AAE3ZYV1_9ACTN|nr:hypothetical protein [Catenuloplanes niger]MDR7327759.1 hypothetical protein [Catenuloplanes niger]
MADVCVPAQVRPAAVGVITGGPPGLIRSSWVPAAAVGVRPAFAGRAAAGRVTGGTVLA